MIKHTALLAALLAQTALSAQATTQDDVLAASLLNGWRLDDGRHMAAVELTLAPGWKTYWRSPGEAGIPPSFDWTGSENLQSARLHWPAPSVFQSNGFQTIGYHDRVILPVEITPKDPSRPVRLVLQMDLGVCDEICLPASVTLTSDLSGPGSPDAEIRASLDQRPVSAREAGLRDIACTVDPISDGLRLTARMNLPDPGSAEVVAFETADPHVWVAESTTRRTGGELVAVTELVPPEGAPFALERSGVTVTVLTAGGAVEVQGCPAP
jgi:DsbC/DsbD-like thiol-disulfide interchange protein